MLGVSESTRFRTPEFSRSVPPFAGGRRDVAQALRIPQRELYQLVGPRVK